jgi:hypothetical protein
VAAKVKRLMTLTARRKDSAEELSAVRRMHERVLQAERILSGDALQAEGVPISNATVAARFDSWCAGLEEQLCEGQMSETERACLEHFVHVTGNMRPQLILCYDLEGLPRTNNEMEGFIRSIKTRYRRLSGRKNWNRYLLRYGRRVAYYEAQMREGASAAEMEERVSGVSHRRWRAARVEQRTRQEEQLKQYRVRHRRRQFLERLEVRWREATQRTSLLP